MYFESYTCNVTFAGNIVQVRCYANPVRFGVSEASDFLSFSASSDAPADVFSSLLVQSVTSQESTPPQEGLEILVGRGLTPDEKAKKEASLARRSRARFARKVSSNFGLYSADLQQASGRYLKFLTLTFRRNVKEWSTAHKTFADFVARLSYHAGDIEYACVPERQKRGAWHFHVIVRSVFIPKGVMHKIWSDRAECGSWYLEKIKSVQNTGAYLSKYMQKSFDVGKEAKTKRYFTSKNLKDLTTVFRASRETVAWLDPFAGRSPVREYSFVADWVGKVDFSEYVFANTAAQEIAAIQRRLEGYANYN